MFAKYALPVVAAAAGAHGTFSLDPRDCFTTPCAITHARLFDLLTRPNSCLQRFGNHHYPELR